MLSCEIFSGARPGSCRQPGRGASRSPRARHLLGAPTPAATADHEPAADLDDTLCPGIVKLRKIRSTEPQDIAIESDQAHDIMGTSLGCVPAT